MTGLEDLEPKVVSVLRSNNSVILDWNKVERVGHAPGSAIAALNSSVQKNARIIEPEMLVGLWEGTLTIDTKKGQFHPFDRPLLALEETRCKCRLEIKEIMTADGKKLRCILSIEGLKTARSKWGDLEGESSFGVADDKLWINGMAIKGKFDNDFMHVGSDTDFKVVDAGLGQNGRLANGSTLMGN